MVCKPGYVLPGGESNLTLACSRGRWTLGKYHEYPVEEFCTPVCRVPCQNNGECVGPDNCKCPDDFTGDYCQTKIFRPCNILANPIPYSAISLE